MYFLSIGIGEYVKGNDDLIELRSAEISAQMVAEELIASGASYGIVLTSRLSEGKSGHVVTREDIINALIDIKKRMRADNAQSPRLLVYIMGHAYGDPQFDILFVQPGDAVVNPRERSQLGVSALVQKTIWNGDILSAAVNYRTHDSMRYMDDFLPSQIMPDLTRPLSGLETAMRAQELMQREEQSREQIGFPPEGNPPVPFVILFDNCYATIEQDIVVDAAFFSGIVRGMWDDIVSDGLVFYAAKPGTLTTDIPIPKFLSPTQEGQSMGRLGALLIKALRENSAPSFAQLRSAMEEGFQPDWEAPWKPYSRSSTISGDVAAVQLLPEKAGIGEFDRR
ncbi:hypothetical protein SSE37_01590 [Sagittula stellata E-37]|uniref:Uncharacterized protein n=1 Tax=Sagittula stellata (strain ATCC 700073 / DSM 11524 / E-37) TaxID=388399 RepID=A3K4K6_SAGS3|nr:hypothetical protein SSE37_01590 [Sagittula stellata E-37]